METNDRLNPASPDTRQDSGKDSSERRCILSGESAPRTGLIRLALGPDGQVAADWSERLPGRGAWITADKALFDSVAAKGRLRGALARAFKANSFTLPDDLADRITATLQQRLLNRLGLEKRAGTLILGGDRVREALANLKKDFPTYDGAEVELAGFVWYQGWNDGVNPKTAVPEYEQNLAHLIRDIRKEFGTPKLPVIVGELTGPWVDAPKEWTALRKAQANVAEYPEFKNNVVFVSTRSFVRKPEDSPNPGHGHHEFGNAETYFLVGDALGKAAVQMAGRDRQVRQVRGWTLRIDERLIAKDAAAVEKAVVILDAQLAKVERLIPAKAVERLRSVPLNFSLPYPDRRPTAEYHGGLAWVKQVGREIALAKAIEFTNIARFEPEIRRMPVLVLHELAHAYHDQVIPGGYQNKDILGAFQQAKAAGTYDAVKRWTGEKYIETPTKAYAMTNQMEYFAEVTEAYFDRNDMEPFDLAELKAKDPGVVPILEKVWGLR